MSDNPVIEGGKRLEELKQLSNGRDLEPFGKFVAKMNGADSEKPPVRRKSILTGKPKDDAGPH